MNSSSELHLLLHALEEGYHRKAWHGPNLRGAIRGLSAAEAERRPGKNRHNIREIVVHCAYWKYVVRRRITGEKRGSFPLKGSNWFTRPGASGDDPGWKDDILLLERTHSELMNAVRNITTADLGKIPKGSRFDNRITIMGIAMHDVYHAGQIQLLKRLVR